MPRGRVDTVVRLAAGAAGERAERGGWLTRSQFYLNSHRELIVAIRLIWA